jgi:putative ABC transport system ATP-binding protein
MLGGLLSPSEGKITIGDIDIYALKRDKLADFRREFMGFIFQSFQLVPYLNVMENVQLPLAVTHHSEDDKKTLALSALDRVGLKDKAHRLPNQLSGGEQERVAIARAVVNEPPILFADEPTGNLDSRNSADVMRLLKRLNSEGQTIVMVTHSRKNAEFGDRIIEVADGSVRETPAIRAVV